LYYLKTKSTYQKLTLKDQILPEKLDNNWLLSSCKSSLRLQHTDSTDFSNSSSTTGIPILDPNFTNFNVKDYVSIYLGPQRNTFPIVVSLTVIYTTIFLTGLMEIGGI
jgi:hypothetical protein